MWRRRRRAALEKPAAKEHLLLRNDSGLGWAFLQGRATFREALEHRAACDSSVQKLLGLWCSSAVGF